MKIKTKKDGSLKLHLTKKEIQMLYDIACCMGYVESMGIEEFEGVRGGSLIGYDIEDFYDMLEEVTTIIETDKNLDYVSILE